MKVLWQTTGGSYQTSKPTLKAGAFWETTLYCSNNQYCLVNDQVCLPLT
jgi:hypothetical protein